MSKAKLTIKAVEMEYFQDAFLLADIKVLQVVKHGDNLNKVEVNYKTEQQLVDTGRYVHQLITDKSLNHLKQTETKQNENGKAKARSKKVSN